MLTSENGAFSALLGTDLKNAKAGTHELRIICINDGGPGEIVHKIKLSARRYPREDLKIEADKLTPPKSLSERIKKEAELGRTAIQTTLPGLLAASALQACSGSYSSVYESRYFNGELRGRHGGIDFRASSGTP